MNTKRYGENTSTTGDDLNQQHLAAALARIDARLQRLVTAWQAAGQDPSDVFKGLYLSDETALALLQRPLSTNWHQPGTLAPNIEESFENAYAQADLQASALASSARSQGHPPRLVLLQEAFGLSTFEVDVLLVCLAPNLDLKYESVYGYLQDNLNLKRPSVSLMLDLLNQPGSDRLRWLPVFTESAPLFRHHLLEFAPPSSTGSGHLLHRQLMIDPVVASWLLGAYHPPSAWQGTFHLCAPSKEFTDPILAAEVLQDLDLTGEPPPLVYFWGPDSLRQQAAARLLALQKSSSLLMVNLSGMATIADTNQLSLRRIFRDAILLQAIPFLYGWDAFLSHQDAPQSIYQEALDFPGLLVLAGEVPWRLSGIKRRRACLSFEFPMPAYHLRRRFWHHCLGEKLVDIPIDLNSLAGQFQLTTTQIRDAAETARDLALLDHRSVSQEDLFNAARSHSNPHLTGLARKLTPRYSWDDMILPADPMSLLREMVSTIRNRPRVLDQWGLGRRLASSRGIAALFAGPPGTGKTMAAEIIAADLGLDLYKIDLSSVISKYIGETEKNLERIFREAETSNAILFFDEADSLFGKRSEVRDSHDRYANIEISYLLQRMEAYDGLTILATNLRANLDEAFTRRLQFCVDFPFPDQPDRLKIWLTLYPPDLPRDTDLDFEGLSHRFKLAGGNIRNILMGAAYLAAADGQVVTMEHLLHSTRRELQKMGRLVDESEMITPQV